MPVLTGIAERERVLDSLRRMSPELRRRGLRHLRMFGSAARGEADPGSDIDLIAELDRTGSRLSLLDLMGIEADLSDRLGRKVEIATSPEQMRPRVRARVDADAVLVY